VVNRQDENLGKIYNLVIDAEHLRLVTRFSSSEVIGTGNKLFVMSWKIFEFHAAEHKLILNSSFDLEPVQTLFRNRLRHFRKLCRPSEGA